MKIKKLELVNYKCFEHLVLENLGDRVVLVGPNGCGKSTILEAIVVVKEYVSTYDPNINIYRHPIPLANKHTSTWHPNLALPIRSDQLSASISLVLELNEAERDFVDGAAEITVGVQIDITSEVTPTLSHSGIAELFRRYEPGSRIGIFDYISPQRQYIAQRITNFETARLSIEQQRRERIELPNPGAASVKFGSTKHFIIGEQLTDLSIHNKTGKDANSLKLLQDLFEMFFGPKVLIGTMNKGDELQVVVDTPSGQHDIDQLSSGERELFNIFTSLFRIRDFPAVILYDEPERHLNPGLESKIIPALDRLQTQNQLWIATHGTELISSVPLQEIIALPRLGGGQPERFIEESKTMRIRLFEELGASVGLQLASNRIVFLEGTEASNDKRIIERLAGSMLPGVLFIASGSSTDVQGGATRANLLIEQASKDAAFLMVLDRDYRDEASITKLTRQLNKRVFFWTCHEIENLLLDPEVILELLRQNGCSNDFSSSKEVELALLEIARSLAEQFSCEWATFRLHTTAESIKGRTTKGPQNEKAYYDMVLSRRERLDETYSEQNAITLFKESKKDVERCLSDGSWVRILPGKAILDKFRSKHIQGLTSTLFQNQMVELMLKRQYVHPEIERLCNFIKAA